MNLKAILTGISTVILLSTPRVFADPQLTSWLTSYSAQYARAYTNTAKRTSGTSVTVWSGQSTPSYADIPYVAYSSSWVYVRAADLPSYVIGPWLNPQGVMGNFYPANQHELDRFPRSPSVQSGTKTISGTGYSGLYVNGIAIFNFTDGKAWDPTNLVIASGPHNKSTFYWHRNAPVGEGYNFDYGLGHQNPGGVYHTHQQPIALRYELGDHVDYNSSTKNYSESTNAVTQHSPIIGWAYDGYPIYGPYGYSVSNDASSGIRRMVSGYVLRTGALGTDNLTNNLNTIPAWYARFRQAHFGGSYSTSTTQTRPSCSSTNYLGTFAEDYSYYGDLTNPATSQLYVMGTNTFDLDVYNGRWCVTPDFPGGTYAYFLDIDTNGTAAYPYAIAYEYYGSATGNSVTSITEPVTTNFYGGADTALTLNSPTANSSYVVSLVWSSTEGGTYQVESSTNQSNWTVEKTGVTAAVGVTTATNYTSSVSNGTVYVRLTRTALASYDDDGGGSGVVAQTNVQSFLIGNDPPTVLNPIPNLTNTYGSAFTYTFASNTFTDIDVGQTLTYTASGLALTNTGISFNGSTRTFSATIVDATNGGTIAGTYTVPVVATDDGTPPMSVTNTFTLVIKPVAASVTANSFTRAYGSTNPTLTGTSNGFVAADSITGNYSTSADTNQAAGSWPISATLSDPKSTLGNYLVTTNNGTLTITDAVLTVTAQNVSRSYGATNPVFTASYSGFVNGQNLAGSGVTGSPALTNSATTNSSVGNYTITNLIGTLAAGNYSFNLVNGQLTVTQAIMSVTASNAARVYGATNPAFGGTISGLVNNDNITATYSCTASTNSTPGTFSIVPALNDPGSKLGNYSVTTNNGTLTVSQASLLVSANNASRAYGATNPVFTVSYSGFANGETASSGTISGAPAVTSAGTNVVVGSYTITNSIGTLASADYSFTLTNGTLTVTQAVMTVTPTNVSRAYGTANPGLTGTISGIANNDNITANYSTTAGTSSPVGAYAINATLNDPGSKLPNYVVTTNQGALTVTTANGSNNYTATLVVSNSLVALARLGTTNVTFTDTNSGLSIVVALTMTPQSLSNANPSFTFLDNFGIGGSAVHLGIQSGLGGGDGNWVDSFESAHFAASLASASSGIATNTIQFGIAEMGVRPNGGSAIWTSSATTNAFALPSENLYALDTNTAALAGTAYAGQFQETSLYQLSDYVDPVQQGLVLEATFTVGAVQGGTPSIGTPRFAGNQFQFAITGTSGANYIVQATTNLTSANWVAICTNAAPFTFTDTNTASFKLRFYRVSAQ